MVETIEKHILERDIYLFDRNFKKHEFTCHFKGNTLIDISPRDTGLGYPLYERDHFKKDKAPVKKVKRYVTSRLIKY